MALIGVQPPSAVTVSPVSLTRIVSPTCHTEMVLLRPTPAVTVTDVPALLTNVPDADVPVAEVPEAGLLAGLVSGVAPPAGRSRG